MEYKEFYSYLIYEDGCVYSTLTNKFLIGEITKDGYKQYTLSINHKSKRYKAHRLVAALFLDSSNDINNNLVVNHKDGNKLNNHYSNLEWCTQDYNNYHARVNGLNDISKSNRERWNDNEFRERTSKKFSDVKKLTGTSRWKNNGRFRYEIYDKNGNEYNRETLRTLLGLSQSYVDKLIKDGANGISNQHFDSFGIYVKDIKGKVNRLSKSTECEKYAS